MWAMGGVKVGYKRGMEVGYERVKVGYGRVKVGYGRVKVGYG